MRTVARLGHLLIYLFIYLTALALSIFFFWNCSECSVRTKSGVCASSAGLGSPGTRGRGAGRHTSRPAGAPGWVRDQLRCCVLAELSAGSKGVGASRPRSQSTHSCCSAQGPEHVWESPSSQLQQGGWCPQCSVLWVLQHQLSQAPSPASSSFYVNSFSCTSP